MDFGLLGTLVVRREDREIPVASAQQRCVLALFLLEPGQVVSTERLMGVLWPDRDPPAGARDVLQGCIFGLRHLLGPDPDIQLVLRSPGYVLVVDPERIDLHRFRALVARARRAGDDHEKAELFDQALALWRAKGLADIDVPTGMKRVLDEERLTALEDRIEVGLRLGHHHELTGELHRLVADHPVRERLRGLLMLALYRDGRQSEALRAFDDLRGVLVEHMVIELGSDLHRLHQRILQGDPTLLTATGTRPGVQTADASPAGDVGQYPRAAVHRTILVVDVEGFGDRRRTNPHQVAVREGLYRVLQQAFGTAGIAWADCWHEDRGDGVFILASAEVPKGRFVEVLPHKLAEVLHQHNKAHRVEEWIRLRMALHAGEVTYDKHGVTSASINLTFRLLEAPALKAALAGSPGVLTLIASEWFFDEVVRHSPVIDPATYRPVRVTVKETTTVGWICRPDHPYPSDKTISGPVTLSGQSRSVQQDTLAETADQLAQAVGTRWQREEEQRQIQDPFPLPVRWQLAPEDLTDHWANICRAPAGDTPCPLALSGQLDEVVDVYRRIPSGRLVVLGRAGSGKTILTLRFVLDLLKTRSRTDAVPVIFSLGSWNPTTTSLRDWLTGQLVRDYPGLAATGPDRSTLAAALVEAGRILPVLDGFDEIADGLHRAALEALNATTLPLLLTSRPTEYATAVAGTDVLTSAAGIELTDLTLTDLVNYLPRTTRKAISDGTDTTTAATVWDPVLNQLREHPQSPASVNLAAVLTTPLMVALARTIYSDTPDHSPSVLLDTDQFSTPEALEDHLLDNFIPTVYRHQPGNRSVGSHRHWDPEHVQHWLGYLAQHWTTSAHVTSPGGNWAPPCAVLRACCWSGSWLGW